ncbi:MAG: mmsB [Nocardioides sp.]|nr:mmsB [Nocardioides sp.]
MTERGRRVAFIGLGTMGFPMASCLVRAGHLVTVSPHRSTEASKALEREGARVAGSPAAAARDAEFVVTMLPTVGHVHEVLLGDEGAAVGAPPGALFVDMSTISPSAARSISQDLETRGLGFIDAPVSGGPAKAGTGALTVMAGGSETHLDRAQPLLAAMAQRVFHVGAVGAGQTAKACNNLLVAACMLANVEALALGASAGIDPADLHEIIRASSGTNWQLENIVPQTVLRNDFTPLFALPLLRKDLAIAAGIAQDSGAGFHVGRLVRDLYESATEEGPARDFSSVVHIYEEALGGGDLATVASRNRESPDRSAG